MPTKSLGDNAPQQGTTKQPPASEIHAPEADAPETTAPEADSEDGMVGQLRQQLDAALAEIERLTKACSDQYLAMLAARDYSVGADARAGQFRGQVKLLERQIEGLTETIEALYERVAIREGEIEAIRLSETWRIGTFVTHPLEPFSKMLRKR